MAIEVKAIEKIDFGITDLDGNYKLGMWVTADETGPDPVYMESTLSVDTTSIATAIDTVLVDNGYDPL